jgi:hypothetical protein
MWLVFQLPVPPHYIESKNETLFMTNRSFRPTYIINSQVFSNDKVALKVADFHYSDIISYSCIYEE